MKNNAKKLCISLFIALLGAISALNYAIFIFPNKFAPAGIDGICTMIQDITGISLGYFSFLVNLPLLILAYFKLDKQFAIRSSIFAISFSVVSAVLSEIDISAFQFHTETNTSTVLSPVAAGVIRGILYAISLKFNASSGGIDVIAALIRKKQPHLNIMNVIFAINLCVAAASYFVYGNHLEPVICGIMYFYITSHTSTSIQTSQKENAKLEIITKNPKELCLEITEKLHLSATVLDSHGAHSGNDSKMVVCIAAKKYVPLIKNIVKTFPGSIYFVSTVSESNTHRY